MVLVLEPGLELGTYSSSCTNLSPSFMRPEFGARMIPRVPVEWRL
jgi:hypothetical protein